MLTPYTYAFTDSHVSIVGPGGNFSVSEGGIAEEGISFDMAEDKNIMTMGADGQGMHNLVASDAAECVIRLLKGSPVNAQLDNMYNFQKSKGGLFHGSNVIKVTQSTSGDNFSGIGGAFKRRPRIVYAKSGGMMEWPIQLISFNGKIGGGVYNGISAVSLLQGLT